MKTNNPIIQHRLNQLRDQKTALLKLKKADRGNQLEAINQTINRLKKWIQEPGTMIEETPRPIKIKMVTDVNDAVAKLKKVFADLGYKDITGGHTETERQGVRNMITAEDILKEQRIANDMERDIRFQDCPGHVKVIGFINSKTGEITQLNEIKSHTGDPTFEMTFKKPTKPPEGIEPTHLIIDDHFPETNPDDMIDSMKYWLTSIERPTRNDESNDDIIVANAKKTPQTNGKPSPITGKWLEETPEAYEARKMDVATAFRRMNGFG